MIVREATLDDVADIVAVHVTNPDRPYERTVESLTIAERTSYGGPWMSVETCAIHVNNLLAWSHVPLVVEERGRVIAETEFYIGQDVPPLGKSLDISVLYVHADFQRQGAGSRLMEAMIQKARAGGCDCVTVSGGTGAPEFYRRFGFGPALELHEIECEVTPRAGRRDVAPLVPADLEPLPEGNLWIGRYLSPTQKWREILDELNARSATLPEHRERPRVRGVTSKRLSYLGFLVPCWGNPSKALVHCWSEALTADIVSELLAEAHAAGYREAALCCHPRVTEVVKSICGQQPTGSRPIIFKPL